MTSTRDRDIRVLLVDDEPLVRSGLAMLIDSEPGLEVVGEAGDGSRVVELVRQLEPDVVVMDVRMPGMDGIQATQAIVSDPILSERENVVTTLILTTFDDDSAVYSTLRAGASGFILKSAAPTELAAAVRALANGDGWLDPRVTRKLLAQFSRRPEPSLPTPAEMAQLTPREREVLTLIAHGFNNSQIAEQLWLSEATVKTHLARILMKLGLHDRAQAVAAAYKAGLVSPADDPPESRDGR